MGTSTTTATNGLGTLDDDDAFHGIKRHWQDPERDAGYA
jgi:hypothetical protein